MLLREASDVFNAEKSLVPKPLISKSELEDFKIWALKKSEDLGCANAVITGSLSRNKTHPYSDIDLEMYTDRKTGFQAFYQWNDRMISLHVEPKWEMEHEVKDPYFQVWHKSTLNDGFIIKDDDGFIKKLIDLVNIAPEPKSVDLAYQRLRQERFKYLTQSKLAFDNGDIWGGLYHFSYYVQGQGMLSCIKSGSNLGGEIGLSEEFAKATNIDFISIKSIRTYLDKIANYEAMGTNINDIENCNLNIGATLKWEDTKVALRRILEYRRKIYGTEKDAQSSKVNLFRFYCLSRIVQSYMAFNKAENYFLLPAQSLSNKNSILENATKSLFCNTSQTLIKMIADDIVEDVSVVLETSKMNSAQSKLETLQKG